MLEVSDSLETFHHPVTEENNSNYLEDSRLIARARAVGVVYEFAQPGVVETEEDRRKRRRRNQRRVSNEERR